MDALLALPAHRLDRLIGALRTGRLDLPADADAVSFALGSVENADAIAADLNSAHRQGLSPTALVLVLRMLADRLGRVPRPDIVWSGPEVPGVHARDTRRVFEELVGGASRSLLISSYAFFDGPRAFELLAQRLDAVWDLEVALCLNIQRAKGDTSEPDEVVRRFSERFWHQDWPGLRRPKVYYDPRSLDLRGPGGVLHAKAVLADRKHVLVTSANLTEAAFDRNFELGLVVSDVALASAIEAQFLTLIDLRLLLPLPAQ
jgi:phosphatidylserine/phosphatidylglycerophosphate/cardiolipin synthase-like enzyme